MAVQVDATAGNIFQPRLSGYPLTNPGRTNPGPGARTPGRLARPSRRTTDNSETRLVELRRRRRLRRLRQAGSTALWVAGSGVLTIIAIGGIFGLH